MKKLLVGLVMLLVSLPALATDGVVNVNRDGVQWRVYNSSFSTMYCRGYLYGQTQLGQVYSERVSVRVPGRMGARRYLRTWGTAYLVSGWAEVDCRL